jgi:integrase/recombinase XerD
MGTIRQKMDADLRLKNLSERTREAYLGEAAAFVRHFMRPPTEFGEAHVQEYLRYSVTEGKASPAKLRMAVAALKFLYRTTLARPEVVANIPWPKKHKTMPTVLSLTEVLTILNAVSPYRNRMLLVTAYDAGLRIGEVCPLKTTDILAERKLIHVLGKGGKERYVKLSAPLLDALRAYWKAVKPPKPFLFPGDIPGRPVTPAGVRKALRGGRSGAELGQARDTSRAEALVRYPPTRSGNRPAHDPSAVGAQLHSHDGTLYPRECPTHCHRQEPA